MELLSSQFNRNKNSFLINLVHQSPQSASQGFSVIGKDYKVSSLPFDPTIGYHEYRIDYLPDQILFYGDGQVVGFMNSTVSPQPGHLILTQWSNGDAGWSAGPPVEPAILSVGYVKAYFNSSSPVRQADALRRCTDPKEAGAVCDIEDYKTPSNITSPETNDLPVPAIFSEFFFNRPNMTANQTVYRNPGFRLTAPSGFTLLAMVLLCMGLVGPLQSLPDLIKGILTKIVNVLVIYVALPAVCTYSKFASYSTYCTMCAYSSQNLFKRASWLLPTRVLFSMKIAIGNWQQKPK